MASGSAYFECICDEPKAYCPSYVSGGSLALPMVGAGGLDAAFTLEAESFVGVGYGAGVVAPSSLELLSGAADEELSPECALPLVVALC